MTYRRPGIQVTQEFQDLLPALAVFNLPNCIIGPAYQVVSDDNVGFYSGDAVSYAYSELNAGNIVDQAMRNQDELDAHQYPIEVRLMNAKFEQVEERASGRSGSTLTRFEDQSSEAFDDVAAGDEIEVLEGEAEIIGNTQGSVNQANPDRLIGSAGQFENVQQGDSVTISGGTDVLASTYSVAQKIDNETLQLNADFFTGSGTVTNVAYRIDRNVGVENAGVYTVREVLSSNEIRLSSPLSQSDSIIIYRVLRSIEEIELERGSHYTADEASISLQAGLSVNGSLIVSGEVLADYRALRLDLSNNVRPFRRINDIQAFFGVDQIVPANPLAFALSIALGNTVTEVNALGLNAQLIDNEQLAYQSALDVLKKTDMYALVPLTQSPVIHQLFVTHVTQMSAPARGKERVAILNRRMLDTEVLIDSKTTSGFRVMVNTQQDGIVTLGSSSLTSPTPMFEDVQPGDMVTIVGGTGIAAGEYEVSSVVSGTEIVLSGVTATYSGSNVQYFIRRADGLEANGQIFYDSSANYLDSDVGVGNFIRIESGNFQGRYRVLSVDSNNQVTLEQVPGVVAVVSNVTYSVDKDMTNTEIAEFLAGYSSAIGNRRAVITFPDTVRIPVGSQTRELPGFYLGAAVGALTTGLPTQQGFTRLTVSGFLGFVNGSDRFDDEQLDIIAGGGTMIFDQEVAEAPLFIRHQLTSDRSSIKFQEYSITKNVDFIAKFLRDNKDRYIGVYNIVDETLDELKSGSQSMITFLREETRFPAIGGVIRSGRLVELGEGVNIDTIRMRFRFDIPIPLNNIDITIEA